VLLPSIVLALLYSGIMKGSLRQSAIITMMMMVCYAVQAAKFLNLTFVMSLFISLNTVAVDSISLNCVSVLQSMGKM